MDTRDIALFRIAVDALRAIKMNVVTQRHVELCQLAIARVLQTQRDIQDDEEIAAKRLPQSRTQP
jgi:hypothetical protein